MFIRLKLYKNVRRFTLIFKDNTLVVVLEQTNHLPVVCRRLLYALRSELSPWWNGILPLNRLVCNGCIRVQEIQIVDWKMSFL